MGLFDFFGGGSAAEKALKLKPKITQKYGEPAARQKAISQLGELNSPDAIPVLLTRFLVSVDPQTTDAEEKQTVFTLITGRGAECVPHVVDFLERNDSASSWALKILQSVLDEPEVIQIATKELNRLGAGYTRDPEKKEVLLHYLQGKSSKSIGPTATPFLHDMSDDVKMAALKTVAPLQYEPARDEMIRLLTGSDTAKRVQIACCQAMVDSGFNVQGHRAQLEPFVVTPFFIDPSGTMKKRDA